MTAHFSHEALHVDEDVVVRAALANGRRIDVKARAIGPHDAPALFVLGGISANRFVASNGGAAPRSPASR